MEPVSVLITGSAVRTCLGNGEQTFAALLQGVSGAGPLRYADCERLNVSCGYHIQEPGGERRFRASGWLAECVSAALQQAGSIRSDARIVALVGTGLRELRDVERCALEDLPIETERLHFGAAIRAVAPQVSDVITLSNACSAGGHALALAQDLLELDEADVVIAAGADAMTESMLAMIGRFATTRTTQVRPFDRDRTGVLLGEGAAAAVLVG
jgi:3-oxoacyl-[acyl-carrier-protein] synthase II